MEIDDEVENCGDAVDCPSAKRQIRKGDDGPAEDEVDNSSSSESFKRIKMSDNESATGEGDSKNTPQTSESATSEGASGKGEGLSKSKFRNRNYRSQSKTDKNSSDEDMTTAEVCFTYLSYMVKECAN